ncbi:MAG: PKD domain-containing protein [Cytophagales bacterium]|nr:PKD domain-containing protein [Cytophagales bacterium]
MKRTLTKLLVFLSLLSSLIVQGSNINTANLRYQCLGNNEYLVTLEVFTECVEGDNSLGSQNILSVFYESAKLGVDQQTLILEQTYSNRWTPLRCQTSLSQTGCSNGGSERGIYRHLYQGRLNLDSFDATDDWVLFFSKNSRSSLNNSLITTTDLPFFTSTIINTGLSTCNSNIYSAQGTSNIFKVCINRDEEFDLGLFENDGDELKFRFEAPKSTNSNNLSYSSGFSATEPISLNGPLSVVDGKLQISATTLNEIGMTTLVIEEWRNGQKISESYRDIQIQTFDCSNEAPTISNFISNSDSTQQVCVNSLLSESISKSDSENSTFFFVDSTSEGISASVFNTSNGRFSWTPTEENIGEHTIIVGVRDNACPYADTVYKTFTIEVVAIPAFDLGENEFLNCDLGKTLSAEITGNAPYTYQWTSSKYNNGNAGSIDDISTDATINVNDLENADFIRYSLTVVDTFGCVNTDQIDIQNSIKAGFNPIKRCIGDSTDFSNSTQILSGNLTSYSWGFDFTNENTEVNDDEEPVVLYPSTGTYNTKLTVNNDLGCSDTYTNPVVICDHPRNVAYERQDSCSLERVDEDGGVPFEDITDYSFTPCGRDSLYFDLYNMESDPNNPYDSFAYGPESIGVLIKFDSEGIYRLHMTTITEAKCIDTFSTVFTIHPRPTISLVQDDIYRNCDEPDTVLVANLDPIEQGTGDVYYVWRQNGIDTLSVQPAPRDSSTQNINEVGSYTVSVWDSLQCSYTLPVQMIYPINADFRYTQVCEPEDSMTFTSTGSSSIHKVVNWRWDLEDGTIVDFDDTNQYKHYYDTPGDYNVTLTITDSTGCTSSKTYEVYNTFPVDTFSVNPVLATSFCKNGELIAQGNYPDPKTGSHIDLIVWTWNGVEQNYSGVSVNNGYTIEGPIPSDVDQLEVNYYILYNSHPEMGISSSCRREPEAITKRLDEEINGKFSVGGSCTGDSLRLKFNQTSSSPIVSWDWSVRERFSDDDAFAPSQDSIATFFIDRELSGKSYDLYATLKDENGCFYNNDGQPFKTETISNVDSVSLVFDREELCLGETIEVTAAEIGRPNSFINTYYVLNNTTGDTLIGEVLNFKTQFPNSFLQENTPAFLREGTNEVSIYATQVNISGGDTTYCGAYTTQEVLVYPGPDLSFTYDTVCTGKMTTINNTSSIEIDNIIGYNWILPDGSTSNERNPSFVSVSGGANDISLEVTTGFGCTNKGGNKLDTTVYFHHTPVVDFVVNSDELEAFIGLPFESTSYVEGAEIATYTFNLGDGTLKTESEFEHTYNVVDIYPVTHSVVSNVGCTAELTREINLNTYLNNPTAFSPNGDGNNDDFGLIHKEIDEIHEFKIYNRWGELVFDGGNDPDARWDGTFRGADQEVGVYILHVKASGAYDQEYNFKKNITLIR